MYLGKTSLLQILAGRSKPLGQVYINGYKYSSDMRRKISFILQEDLFLESSSYTVRDHLSFFSALKSCSKMKASERVSVINSLTSRLGINHLLDIPIDFLSGGEQKRVSICAGLLGEGKILLIDEGTSGLDSGASHAFVKTLRQLADEMRVAILLSIHAPNTNVYNLFDKLLILCEGKTVYNGYCLNFMQFLSSAGFHEQSISYSPLDFVLDILYVDDAKRSQLMNQWNDEELLIQLNCIIEGSNNKGKRQLIEYPANYGTQLVHLFIRSLKSSSTNSFSFLNITQTVAVALVIGSCWLQLQANTESNITPVTSYLFFINAYFLFWGMFGGLLEFIPELKIITLDRQAGLYRLSAYFLSKTISCLPAKIVHPLIFSLVSYPMVIVPFQVKTYFLVSCCLVLTTLMGDSLGLFIGTFTHKTNQAISLCVIISIAILLLGGFFIKQLSSYLEWAKYVSFLRYSYLATIKLQFQSYPKIYCDHEGNAIALCRNKPYIPGDIIVQYFGSDERYPGAVTTNDGIIIDISICLAFFLFFRFASYILLRFNHFKMRRE